MTRKQGSVDDSIARLLHGTPTEAEQAKVQLVSAGPAAVPRLLDFADEKGARQIWDVLETIGAGAIPAIKARRRDNPHLSRGEARVLATGPEGWDILIGALSASEDGTRANAAFGLGRTTSRAAIGYLQHALADVSWQVRSESALALGGFGDESSIEALGRLAADEVPEVRSSAIWALGGLGGRAAAQRVIASLRDRDVTVRITAIETASRGRLGGAVPILLELLDSADPGTGTGTEIDAILDALGEIGDLGAEDALTRLLASHHAEWRADPKTPSYGDHAAEVLDRLGAATGMAAAREWRGRAHGG